MSVKRRVFMKNVLLKKLAQKEATKVNATCAPIMNTVNLVS